MISYCAMWSGLSSSNDSTGLERFACENMAQAQRFVFSFGKDCVEAAKPGHCQLSDTQIYKKQKYNRRRPPE